MAERYLQATANVDLGSPTTRSSEGIHIAALGGLWLATIFGIAGFRTLDGELAFEPVLPEAWQAFAFRIQWRDRLIRIRIDRQKEIVGATLERGEPLVLRVSGKRLFLETGKSIEFFCAAG